jgi:hypothetical protein
MRWMCWLAVVLAGGVLTDAASGQQPAAPASGCSSCNGAFGTAAAPACCFPCYGLAPGCCETRPSCCDNAWATYCQGKAYRQQRYAMWRAMHPAPVPWAQPAWSGPVGMIQPVPDTWLEEQPATPVPLPDPNGGPGT